MSNYLWPNGLLHIRHHCLSISPGVCSNSCPLSWSWYLITSSSAPSSPFAFNISQQSGSFPVSQLFASGGQSIGASASAIVLAMNILGWFPLRLILAGQGTLKRLLQQHNLKASILWFSASFMVQLLYLYMTPGNSIALIIWIFVGKVMSFAH